MKSIFIIVSLFLSLNATAQLLPVHGPSQEQIEAMALANQATAAREALLAPLGGPRNTNVLPFFEGQTTGYVVFDDDDYYGVAEDMKKAIAAGLPDGVTLLVTTASTNKSYQKQLHDTYSQYIATDRIKILQVPTSGNSFWARDNLPLPVWENGQFALVDARYYYNYEPDAYIAKLFGVTMQKHNYFYEGGNFMANAKGDCLVVNRKKAYPGGVSDTAAIPDSIFKDLYGCKTLLRFKHLKGIGHADEVVKFISDDTVLTDTPEYVADLEKAGFKVIELPEPDLNYETYINSLQVNNTMFVPIFGESGDQKAIDIYKNLGYDVVTIDTRDLATQGQGGIHCITMNYPPQAFAAILNSLDAVVVEF